MKTYHGPVSEVWFQALGTSPPAASSFLIRNDSYTELPFSLPRIYRFGTPINLGPLSAWRQTSWEGGNQQEEWKDEAMYLSGNLDTGKTRGKVQMNCALGVTNQLAGRANVSRMILGRNAVNTSRSTPQPLFMGENNLGGAVPTGGFKIYRADPGVGVTTLASNTDFEPSAMSPVDDNSSSIFIGGRQVSTGKGLLISYDQATGAQTIQYVDPDGIIQTNSMAFYNNALYWLAGFGLKQRYNGTGTPAYKLVFSAAGCQFTRGIAVHNTKLWFGGVTPSMHTRIYVTDGNTTSMAFEMEGEFEIEQMVSHYGSLYICGGKPGADRTSWQGEIWKYDGGTLKRLYQAGTGEDGEDHTIWAMTSFGSLLAWSQQGRASNNFAAGIMYFDAEVDSIFSGPTHNLGRPQTVTDIINYDQTLAISVHEDPYSGTTYNTTTARPIRKQGVVRNSTGSNVEQYILSSRYDGELPGEDKTWLVARVRAKVPANTEVELRYLLDDSPTEHFLVSGIITEATGSTQFRTYVIPLKDGISHTYLKSAFIQYKLYLRNTDNTNANSSANPVVDTVEIEFLPAPRLRKSWRIRVLLDDNQLRLNGTANPLTNVAAQMAYLEATFDGGGPVMFWPRSLTGGNSPPGSGVEVLVTEFSATPWRLDDTSTEQGGEFSMTLVENVAAGEVIAG